MPERSVTHATFTIERTYPASPARVFRALADKDAKSKWFAGPDEWAVKKYEMDFRVRCREVNSGGSKGGTIHTFNAIYQDIVENERIIYAYEAHLGVAGYHGAEAGRAGHAARLHRAGRFPRRL
jgi:uncharacterized protein YndB with AHSA1/START domain